MAMGKVFRAVGVVMALLTGPAAALELTGAGATFPSNLYAGWIAAFNAVDPAVQVTYEPVGSGEGIRRFVGGKLDFGATDRPMTDDEIAEVPGGVLHVPATAGMVAIAYNVPGIPTGLKLSRTALAGIFSGLITTWDDPVILDLNPTIALPNRTIAVVGRRDSSGTTFALTNHLHQISDIWKLSGRDAAMVVDWPGGAMTASGNEGVAGRIQIAEYSIGYVEASFARMFSLSVAALENASGTFVMPDVSAGATALAGVADAMPADGRQLIADPSGHDAYPIVSYSWLLLAARGADGEKTAALRRFVEFGLGEGQTMAEPLGFIPLPASTMVQARAILAQLH